MLVGDRFYGVRYSAAESDQKKKKKNVDGIRHLKQTWNILEEFLRFIFINASITVKGVNLKFHGKNCIRNHIKSQITKKHWKLKGAQWKCRLRIFLDYVLLGAQKQNHIEP